MDFKIYRDLASIMFVRCVSPIPGAGICAEGAGFTVLTAVEKCRSERIEARFQLSHPLRDQMIGIAAHPDAIASAENAWNEALETLALESLAATPIVYGISVRSCGVRLCLARLNDRFLALVLFSHRGIPTATQAVSKSPFRAALKAWTEVRNLRLYNPRAEDLLSYTKANRILGGTWLYRTVTKASFRRNVVDTSLLKLHQAKEESHFVSYFTKETL